MLIASDVRKSFDGQLVLKGASLEVGSGEVVSIIGPSGSGKTTLLRCINFLEKADSGSLSFQGQGYDLASISRKDVAAIRLQTGFVFQSYNLFRNRTALGNVTEGLVAARGMKIPEAQAIAMEALSKVGLAEKRDFYPHELSGGQQQRVAIARAIAAKPRIIYFDEPTSALDPELIGEVLQVIRQLAEEGMTMVIVTHEMHFARTISSKAVFIEDGSVLESGPAEAFFRSPSTQRAAAFLKSIDEDRT